jgi:nitroreductase
MNIRNAITSRRSVRAFLEEPVAAETVREILEAARWAPSGANTQPWEVQVVLGETRRRIIAALAEARKANESERPDYQYYPKEWFEPYTGRKTACGMSMYRALGTLRKTPQSRLEAWNRNYSFFGAPIVLFFSIHQKLAVGSWLDYGMFIQNVCLGAHSYGLGTCVQTSPADYPDLIREILCIPSDRIIIGAVSIGIADPAAPINQFRTSREAVDDFTTWHY